MAGVALIGLDIGTTSTIGVLIDADGHCLATVSRPVELISEQAGWAEEEPRQWWANSQEILRELAACSLAHGLTLRGLGVSGMVPAVVLLDAQGEPLRRSIQQSDGRTSREVDSIRVDMDEPTHIARTGCGINQQLVGAKWRWLRAHEPEVLAKARTLFGSYDFIAHRLTGVRRVEQNWALESGLLSLATHAFDPVMLALHGIAEDVLPAVARSHEVIGRVSREAAELTGVPVDLPVVGGCADHVASAFAAGVRQPGDVLLKFGGAGDILTVSDAPHTDPRLFLDFHVVPGRFMPNGCMASSGAVLNWLAELLGHAHPALDALAEAIDPEESSLVLLPYFLGEKTPLHDPLARGTLIGLGLHHRAGHLWRAALEGIAFGFRHHLDVMTELGMKVDRVIVSDGGAKSRVWMQIVADVIDRPVRLLAGHTGSSIGVAFVAGMGVGVFDDWEQIGRFVQDDGLVLPASRRGVYDRLYGVYRQTYARLQPVYPHLKGQA